MTKFISAKYSNEDATSIIVEAENGQTLNIPTDEGNRHYQELLKSEVAVESYIALTLVDKE